MFCRRQSLKIYFGFFGIFLFSFLIPLHADERFRPKTPDQLIIGTEKTQAVRVLGARVSFANYFAIRRDFKEIADAGLSDAQIDEWLLENFAYINREQLRLNGIRNSPIPVNLNDTKADYRPPTYGRAGVLEGFYKGKAVGLVDIKGLGHSDSKDPRNKSQSVSLKGKNVASQILRFEKAKGNESKLDGLRTLDHSDGLSTHGEAIAETSRQFGVQQLEDIFNAKMGTDYQTVESYAVIELPFDILKDKGKTERAALYLRQAHWRGGQAVTPPDIYRDPFGGRQGTLMGSAVDFGGALLDISQFLKFHFGVIEGGWEGNPQHSRPWAWGHDVARAFERGDLKVVYRHLAEMLAPIHSDWDTARKRELTDAVKKRVRLWETLRSEGANSEEIGNAASHLKELLAQKGKFAETLKPNLPPAFLEKLLVQVPWQNRINLVKADPDLAPTLMGKFSVEQFSEVFLGSDTQLKKVAFKSLKDRGTVVAARVFSEIATNMDSLDEELSGLARDQMLEIAKRGEYDSLIRSLSEKHQSLLQKEAKSLEPKCSGNLTKMN